MNPSANAFPVLMKVGEIAQSEGGLTKRELFAAMAMQGILACPDTHDSKVVSAAVHYADALLAELAKEKP